MESKKLPEPEAESVLIEAYLAGARTAKLRRLSALTVLCALLLGVLIVIYVNDWYAQSGGGGAGWVFCGIVVTLCAIGGVLIDIFYRKDL
ncbi:hypothetical protein A5638_20215 [Mycolicibacterium fortuitum]|uniref:hypothetical protein n=1 Tax=Mycolicibacterium fortuitum TaxID=1766 RepID=UPI0007EE1562|nr:hypothetical protein [Mycolicibacterium fortuitum]OBJ95434.1 hypothetical protein A5638_20215 [Mycolicibacterium fortuitum]